MISFLLGTIEEKEENNLVLNVNGIGFDLCVSNNTLMCLPSVGNAVKIYTYMAVREDDVSMYGFSSKEERDIFFKLITVSGIGPKIAISILSGLSLNDLTLAIFKSDLKLLSQIKGLGKKTAERICVELKDKVTPLDSNMANLEQNDFDEDAVEMATDTLISLGISKNDAYMMARSYATKDSTAEEIISKALRGYKG